jgi:hypothetical protein
VREIIIMVFPHSNGVGAARAVRIFRTYGTDAGQVMTERLARDIRGIGFKTAEATFLGSLHRIEKVAAAIASASVQLLGAVLLVSAVIRAFTPGRIGHLAQGGISWQRIETHVPT